MTFKVTSIQPITCDAAYLDSSDRDHDRDPSVVGQGMSEPNRLRLVTEVLARASDPTHPAHEYIAEHHRLSLAYAAKLHPPGQRPRPSRRRPRAVRPGDSPSLGRASKPNG